MMHKVQIILSFFNFYFPLQYLEAGLFIARSYYHRDFF